MKYFIITGTSRGLGASLAKHLLQKGNALFCISRTENVELVSTATQNDVFLRYLSFDLQEAQKITSLMDTIMQEIDLVKTEALFLINNAALLGPVKPAGRYPHADVITSVHVNLIAPMLLSSAFIQHTTQVFVDKRIINITTGAAHKPHFGWGAYCSTKAGLEMFTRCVGIEQQEQSFPVKIVAVAPGIIDTSMQDQIRQTDKEDFQEVEKFIGFHENGLLVSPDVMAKNLIEFFQRDDLEHGEIYDIRQFK